MDNDTDGIPEEVDEVRFCLFTGHPYNCCSALHVHGKDCRGGYEVPQSEYAWLLPGPWRRREVQR